MAYKITHATACHQLTFPNREAAERYAEHNGGGRERWTIGVAQPDWPAEERQVSWQAELRVER
jgi:hypothetical protein